MSHHDGLFEPALGPDGEPQPAPELEDPEVATSSTRSSAYQNPDSQSSVNQPLHGLAAGAGGVGGTRQLVGLSNSSVYPEGTATAFEYAGRLGYDGLEIMVGIDSASVDEDEIERLRDFHQLPVLSIHAPCLLFTVRTWGTDSWEKLRRSASAALRFDTDVVVVHPPFRWQRDYAAGFVDGIRQLREDTGVRFCVENMYPWRTPKRGLHVGGKFKAYKPGFDPTRHDFDHLTLDLSHASTARQQALELARTWGPRLQHVHLTDGTGSIKDEHLLPGHGDQRAGQLLQLLATEGYSGQVVVEVNTRRSGSREQRENDLGEALAFAHTHLSAGARSRSTVA